MVHSEEPDLGLDLKMNTNGCTVHLTYTFYPDICFLGIDPATCCTLSVKLQLTASQIKFRKFIFPRRGKQLIRNQRWFVNALNFT